MLGQHALQLAGDVHALDADALVWISCCGTLHAVCMRPKDVFFNDVAALWNSMCALTYYEVA